MVRITLIPRRSPRRAVSTSMPQAATINPSSAATHGAPLAGEPPNRDLPRGNNTRIAAAWSVAEATARTR